MGQFSLWIEPKEGIGPFGLRSSSRRQYLAFAMHLHTLLYDYQYDRNSSLNFVSSIPRQGTKCSVCLWWVVGGSSVFGRTAYIALNFACQAVGVMQLTLSL